LVSWVTSSRVEGYRGTTGGDLHGGCAHPGGEQALGVRWDRWSSVTTRHQHDSDFHAGTPITSVTAKPASGCRTASVLAAPAGGSVCAIYREGWLR